MTNETPDLTLELRRAMASRGFLGGRRSMWVGYPEDTTWIWVGISWTKRSGATGVNIGSYDATIARLTQFLTANQEPAAGRATTFNVPLAPLISRPGYDWKTHPGGVAAFADDVGSDCVTGARRLAPWRTRTTVLQALESGEVRAARETRVVSCLALSVALRNRDSLSRAIDATNRLIEEHASTDPARRNDSYATFYRSAAVRAEAIFGGELPGEVIRASERDLAAIRRGTF